MTATFRKVVETHMTPLQILASWRDKLDPEEYNFIFDHIEDNNRRIAELEEQVNWQSSSIIC